MRHHVALIVWSRSKGLGDATSHISKGLGGATWHRSDSPDPRAYDVRHGKNLWLRSKALFGSTIATGGYIFATSRSISIDATCFFATKSLSTTESSRLGSPIDGLGSNSISLVPPTPIAFAIRYRYAYVDSIVHDRTTTAFLKC